MKTCGIVAEYNPFHYGHAYHIEQARKLSGADVIIAVMSGNFVQRGEPAVTDKWERSACAIRNGVDVVLELPYIYATQAASQFAKGATDVLKLAKADCICFGSECGNLENLMEIADTPVNPDHLHKSMSDGTSFPKAYSLLTSSMEPNDILGVSYLKHIKDTNIQPLLVQRTTGYLENKIHKDTFSSAYAIRNALKTHTEFTGSTPMEKVLLNSDIPWMEKYYPYFRTFMLTSDKEALQNMFLFSEGIENHLIKNAAVADDFETFLNNSTTYRYTNGRIKRTMLQAMNQITKQEVRKLPTMQAIRVLAFNDTGRQWLHSIRKQDIQTASRFAKVPYPYRTMEYKSTLLYTSVMDFERRKLLLEKEIGGAQYIQ